MKSLTFSFHQSLKQFRSSSNMIVDGQLVDHRPAISRLLTGYKPATIFIAGYKPAYSRLVAAYICC